MPEPTYGWVTETEANNYMFTRLGASTYWYTGADKVAALTTAYNMLTAGSWSFPTTISLNMQNAQFEMALFLLQHQAGMDARMGLQAQGVTQAGIVEETYKGDGSLEIPFPPMVKKFLYAYETKTGAEIMEVSRDDDEGTTL